MPKIGSLTVSMFREESESTGQITEAVCAAQLEFPPIHYDSDGFRDGEKYRYASISSIRRCVVPVLAKHGVLMQHIYGDSERGAYVTTILRHKTGEYLTSTLRIPPISDIQDAKAAKTLLCRTAIEGLLSITTEEDTDGRDVAVMEDAPKVDAETQRKWQQNLALAEAAVCMATDDATLEKYLNVAKKRVASGDMPPDAVERIESLCKERSTQLKEKRDDRNEGTSGDQGPDAAGSGSGKPDRRGRRPVGTGA
jgi:hypothetical protein